MRPILKNVGTYQHPHLRSFFPDDPSDVVLHLLIEVGCKGKRGTEEFTVLVATPTGLAGVEPSPGGVIRAGKMVLLVSYDFDSLWGWLDTTVASCTSDTWDGCVEKMRAYFDWEFAKTSMQRQGG